MPKQKSAEAVVVARNRGNEGLNPPYHYRTEGIADRVGGGLIPAVLSQQRAYGSVHGGSYLLANSVSELGCVDVSPASSERPGRPLEFPTSTS